MPPICQCRADTDPTQAWGESDLCNPEFFTEAVNFPESNPKDRTGQDGYRLMSHFSLSDQQRIIGQLPVNGYGGRVRRFATAVTQMADELQVRYKSIACDAEDSSTTENSKTEKPLRGAKWTLKVFIRRVLRRRYPELATLPIQYSPRLKSDRAAYSTDEDKIYVGNGFIRDIRSGRHAPVLSTLYHEKTHRDSELRHRTITESLVNEAIALAAGNIHNPNCTTDAFKEAAKHQLWWEDNGGLDHEDEVLARITQLVFRSAHSAEQSNTAQEDIRTYESYLHSHIAGIANRFSPRVAGVIFGYIEETVKADIPNGYSFLVSSYYSDANYNQILSAQDSYKYSRQICQAGQNPTCRIPSNTDGRMMAEHSD